MKEIVYPMLAAGFGAFCQEIVYLYYLRSTLPHQDFLTIFRSLAHWTLSVLMIICASIGIWLLFGHESLPNNRLFVLGAGFPPLLKIIAAPTISKMKGGLHLGSEDWIIYFGLKKAGDSRE